MRSGARTGFHVRVAEGCLRCAFAPTLHAMKELSPSRCGFAGNSSRYQRAAPQRGPQLAVAARWQAEVHRGVRYVLDAVKRGAGAPRRRRFQRVLASPEKRRV